MQTPLLFGGMSSTSFLGEKYEAHGCKNRPPHFAVYVFLPSERKFLCEVFCSAQATKTCSTYIHSADHIFFYLRALQFFYGREKSEIYYFDFYILTGGAFAAKKMFPVHCALDDEK